MSSHTVWPNHVTHLLFKSANPCTAIQLELINTSSNFTERVNLVFLNLNALYIPPNDLMPKRLHKMIGMLEGHH